MVQSQSENQILVTLTLNLKITNFIVPPFAGSQPQFRKFSDKVCTLQAPVATN